MSQIYSTFHLLVYGKAIIGKEKPPAILIFAIVTRYRDGSTSLIFILASGTRNMGNRLTKTWDYDSYSASHVALNM